MQTVSRGKLRHVRASQASDPSTQSRHEPAVGHDHRPGRALAAAQQRDAQHAEEHAVGQFDQRHDLHVPQGRDEADEEIEGDDRQQPEGQEHDQALVVAAAEDQVGEPAAEGQDRQHRRHGQHGAEPGRAAEEAPQLARLPVAIDVPPERARQRHHQQRPGQHEEAEGHVPLAELFRAEPAAEADLPRKADRALQHGRCQQQHDAQGQGIAVQRRRSVDRRLAVHGDRVGSCGGFVHIINSGQNG